MRRYTTPTLTLLAQSYDESTDTLSQADLTEYEVWVTIEQAGVEIEIHNPTMELTRDGTLITVKLTQEQTASLTEGQAAVQVNWMSGDGTRGATDIGRVRMSHNLLEEVLEYGA